MQTFEAVSKKPVLVTSIPENVIRNYTFLAGVSFDKAKQYFEELEKFLFLCARNDRPYVPSPAVDSVWHDFIVHTRDYHLFCNENFGHFIHHVPQRDGSANLKEHYVATIGALEEVFGKVDHSIWPRSDAFMKEVCTYCTTR